MDADIIDLTSPEPASDLGIVIASDPVSNQSPTKQEPLDTPDKLSDSPSVSQKDNVRPSTVEQNPLPTPISPQITTPDRLNTESTTLFHRYLSQLKRSIPQDLGDMTHVDLALKEKTSAYYILRTISSKTYMTASFSGAYYSTLTLRRETKKPRMFMLSLGLQRGDDGLWTTEFEMKTEEGGSVLMMTCDVKVTMGELAQFVLTVRALGEMVDRCGADDVDAPDTQASTADDVNEEVMKLFVLEWGRSGPYFEKEEALQILRGLLKDVVPCEG